MYYYSGFGEEVNGMREERHRFIHNAQTEAHNILAEAKGEDAARKGEIKNLMKTFSQEDKARTDEMKQLMRETKNFMAHLSQENKALEEETHKLLAGLAAENKILKRETRELVGNFKRESAERAAAWQQTLTMIGRKAAAPRRVIPAERKEAA